MSLHHNPRIVTDGLVFAYDMDNVAKSFKGKPTTNLITSTIDNWSGSSLRNATLLNETYKRSAVYRLEVAAGADPATNVDAYYMYNVPNLSEGDVFTFSADVRVIQKSTATSQTSPADNGFWIWFAGSSEHVNFKDLELGKWTNIQVTATVGSTYDYIWARIDHDNSIIDIANIQLEQQPFATPFVNGTRSNTQALLDMSKSKNTVTATSLTYRQDDTPTFDGTDDYLNIAPQSIPANSSLSLSVWINTSSVSASSIIEAENFVGGRTLNVHIPWSDNTVYFDCGGANSSTSYDRITYATTVEQRTGWHNWVFTKDISANEMRIYADGNLVVFAGNKNIIPGPTQFATIGSYVNGASNFYNGEISQVKIYDRALTAAEIKQNFNATRGRFGI